MTKKKVSRKGVGGAPKGSGSKYNDERAAAICGLLAEGNSARYACGQVGIDMVTFYAWQRAHPEFAQQVSYAREDQADTFADQMCDIADMEEDVARAKLKIDARKWVAARMKPRSWGDRQDVNVGVQQSLADVMREIGSRSALDIARERSQKD